MRISLRFLSCRYDTSGSSGKILRVSGSVDKMLKLLIMVCLVRVLNGLYVSTSVILSFVSMFAFKNTVGATHPSSHANLTLTIL